MGAPRGTFAGEVGGGGGAPEARAAGAGRDILIATTFTKRGSALVIPLLIPVNAQGDVFSLIQRLRINFIKLMS